MKRDVRLRGLSSEHHQALVLARRLSRRAAAGALDAALALELAERFTAELEPHFRVEEEVLLTALDALGEGALVERTRSDHAYLREAAARAARGELEVIAAFAERLVSHVRFEERELFPVCEARLGAAVLDEVEWRVPHGEGGAIAHNIRK